MRTYNTKSILAAVIALSVALCLSGCIKQPATPTTDPITESTNPSEDTKPTENIIPTENTTPSTPIPTETTTPVDATDPTAETPPVDCVHESSNWIVETASTCTTEGLRFKECNLCNFKIETEVIPMVSHSGGAWIVDQKATCTSEGSQHQECAQCKMTLLHIVVAKADHKTFAIKGYSVTNTTPGLTQGYLCSVCGSTVQDQYTIPALNSIDFTYTINTDHKTCTITGVRNKKDDAIILPDTINGYTITAIADNAFSGCSSLKTVYLPSAVTSIGTYAFRNCTALTNITFAGTTAQWIYVAKGSNWNSNTGNYTIYCTNNYLSK